MITSAVILYIIAPDDAEPFWRGLAHLQAFWSACANKLFHSFNRFNLSCCLWVVASILRSDPIVFHLALALISYSLQDLFLLLLFLPKSLDFNPCHISTQNVSVIVNEVLENWLNSFYFTIKEFFSVLSLSQLNIIAHIVVLDNIKHIPVELFCTFNTRLKYATRVVMMRPFIIYNKLLSIWVVTLLLEGLILWCIRMNFLSWLSSCSWFLT